METYKLLREIDYVENSLKNLAKEVKEFIPPHTRPISPGYTEKEDSIEAQFSGMRHRIDAMAAILSAKNKPSEYYPWWAADAMFKGIYLEVK